MLALQKQRYQGGEKYLNAFGMMKLLSPLKKNEEYAWLANVSNGTLQTICRDLDKAYSKFFNKTSNLPKFKNRKRSKPSFPVRADRFYLVNNTAHIQMIGKVIYRTNYDLPQGREHKFLNPRISYVGGKWLLTFGMERENQAPVLTDQFMGIDLGIKDLATVSFGQEKIVYHNINKSRKIRQLERKRRHMQRIADRRRKGSKRKTKADDQVARIYRRQANIRQDYRHQTTKALVNLLPRRVAMEDLNVSGMMKNRYLARAIAEQGFDEFIRQMHYKCKWYGIEFIQVPRFYPSSKTCSSCGNIKRNLKLKDRTYVCEICGLTIDRDFNAALNLQRYNG